VGVTYTGPETFLFCNRATAHTANQFSRTIALKTWSDGVRKNLLVEICVCVKFGGVIH